MNKEKLEADKLAMLKEAVDKVVSEELTLDESAEKYGIDKTVLESFIAESQGEKLEKAPKKTGYDDASEEDDNPKVEGADELKNGSGGNKKQPVKEDVTVDDLSESVTEHMNAFFKGEELSGDFKVKAKTIFENAVLDTSRRIIAESRVRLQEEFDTKIEEKVTQLAEEAEEYKTSLDEKVNEYLSYVVEDWMKENKVAVQSTLRSDLTESFISGLKVLFEEHYIEIPQEKADVLEQMAEKLSDTENEVEKLISENNELKKQKAKIQMDAIAEKVSYGLSENQKERFLALTENINYSDASEYENSLKTIKESYFDDDNTKVLGVEADDTPLENLEEQTVLPKEEEVKPLTESARAAAVLAAMLKTRK